GATRFVIFTLRPPPRSPLFPYTTLFRSPGAWPAARHPAAGAGCRRRSKAPDHGRYAPARAAPDPGHGLPGGPGTADPHVLWRRRSEEHTSELQSRENLVCRLLLEKKNKN